MRNTTFVEHWRMKLYEHIGVLLAALFSYLGTYSNIFSGSWSQRHSFPAFNDTQRSLGVQQWRIYSHYRWALWTRTSFT